MSDSASTPSSQNDLQSAHVEQPTTLPMHLLAVFHETFLLMARYFIILYPLIFFYLIGMNFLAPVVNHTPDFQRWAWWAILLGVPAIGFILKAGWQGLLYQCIQEWQFLKTQLKDEKDRDVVFKHAPFALFKHLIPAIGEYGVSFLFGNLLWLMLMALPMAGILWWGYTQLGIPPTLEKLTALIAEGKIMTEAQVNAMLLTVPERERLQIGQWGLYLMLGSAATLVFNLMTYFWQPYLIIKRCNPFRAMVYSMQHLVRYPLHTVSIFLAFFGFTLLTFFIAGLSMVGSFFAHFMFILMTIYAGLFSYLYLDYLHVHQDYP